MHYYKAKLYYTQSYHGNIELIVQNIILSAKDKKDAYLKTLLYASNEIYNKGENAEYLGLSDFHKVSEQNPSKKEEATPINTKELQSLIHTLRLNNQQIQEDLAKEIVLV